jgi:hypothetical protein
MASERIWSSVITPGVADDVRISLGEAENPVEVQPGVHAGDDGQLATGRNGEITLVEGGGVILRSAIKSNGPPEPSRGVAPF